MAKVRGRERTAVSVYAKKLWNLRSCSRRSRKGHNSKEACSSLTLLANTRVTKKKSLPSQIPEGELMQRIKDRRRNILQHLQKNPRRRSNRTNRCFHTKRPSQAMKHRGSRNSQPHRAEACKKTTYTPYLRRQATSKKPTRLISRTRRRPPNPWCLLSHTPGENA